MEYIIWCFLDYGTYQHFFLIVTIHIIAKLSSSWQVQYQSNWELRLV